MSNILLITPIYRIIGREDLFRDTECIYDLTKYWTENNNLYVISPFIYSIKNIYRYLKKENRNYYKNGYHYKCNKIPVTILERQNVLLKQKRGYYFAANRFKKMINNILNEEKFSPDIIIVHLPFISEFFINKLNYNCKKIAILHYSDVAYLKRRKKKFINHLEKNYQYVFCRSNAIYNEFKKENLKNLRKPIIYSGVPTMNIDYTIINKKFKKEKINLLYVGKLIERKNLDILIKALKKIDNKKWELKVVGQGEFFNNYHSLVDKLNLKDNVKFMGYVKKEKVFDIMKNSDIFCMPSINETLGLVYIEAMANGCITIGTKNEGIDGIIENNKNGYLVNPDENELANTILKIINMDNNERKTIIKNSIETGKKYNEIDMSQQYLNIVNEVIDNE